MNRRLGLPCILTVTCAGMLSLPSTGAPIPKEDWWLEIEDPSHARHFVRVATGERRRVRAPLPERQDVLASPDGKWIAEVRERPTLPDQLPRFTCEELFVRPAGDKASEVCLGPTACRLYGVAWMRDSKRIVFLTNRDGWRAYSASPDGSDIRRLTQAGGFSQPTPTLRLLPDGRALHVGGRKRVDFKPHPNVTILSAAGHLVISDGVRDRYLCRDSIISSFEPSPDGTKVAYEVGNQSSSELVVHDLLKDRVDRIQVRNFRPGWECICGNMVWRPDGGAVAFAFTHQYFSLPKDQTPFRHIGIADVGSTAFTTDAIAFREWSTDERGYEPVGFELVRWVTDIEVQRDGRR